MADDHYSDHPGHLLSAPLEALITGVGRSVARAQREMDLETARSIVELGLGDNEKLERLRRLGHQPTWFRIPEAQAELTVALSLHGSEEEENPSLYATPADASFTNKYSYDLTAASKVTFKVVAVPAPPATDDLVVVPNLRNKRFDQAIHMLEQRQIGWQTETEAKDRKYRKVTSTEPAAGEMIRRGELLSLKLSKS